MRHLKGEISGSVFEGEFFHAKSINLGGNTNELRVGILALTCDVLIRNEDQAPDHIGLICSILDHVIRLLAREWIGYDPLSRVGSFELAIRFIVNVVLCITKVSRNICILSVLKRLLN